MENNNPTPCDIHKLEIEYIKQEMAEFKNLVSILNTLTTNIEKIALEMKYYREGFDSLSSGVDNLYVRVSDIEKRPLKIYESIAVGTVMLIIGLIFGIVATFFGIK